MIFPQAEFIMNFDNPTEALTGKRTSVQGFSVYEDYAIVLYHAGVCAVYDLITRDPAPLAAFKLATYDAGEEDKRYANHANDMMFGGFDEAGNPLMYITAGNSGEADEKGYIAYCAVEALEITTDEEGKKHFGSRLVQKIYYQNDGIENVPFQSPCWGWPASLVDVKNGRFYLHSARYRTTKDFVHLYNENNYIVTAAAILATFANSAYRCSASARFFCYFGVAYTFLKHFSNRQSLRNIKRFLYCANIIQKSVTLFLRFK